MKEILTRNPAIYKQGKKGAVMKTTELEKKLYPYFSVHVTGLPHTNPCPSLSSYIDSGKEIPITSLGV